MYSLLYSISTPPHPPDTQTAVCSVSIPMVPMVTMSVIAMATESVSQATRMLPQTASSVLQPLAAVRSY